MDKEKLMKYAIELVIILVSLFMMAMLLPYWNFPIVLHASNNTALNCSRVLSSNQIQATTNLTTVSANFSYYLPPLTHYQLCQAATQSFYAKKNQYAIALLALAVIYEAVLIFIDMWKGKKGSVSDS